MGYRIQSFQVNNLELVDPGSGSWNRIAVWLKADIELLMKRVRRRDNRPLLKADNPEEVMQTLIEQRYPVYGRADIIVESRDVPHSSIVSDVIRALAAYQRAQKAAERIA